MSNDPRILQDWQRLKERAQQAGFWTLSNLSESAHEDSKGKTDQKVQQIEIVIRGKGIASAGPDLQQVSIGERQKIRLVFEDPYPQKAPTIHIESAIFHPNIAADGLVSTSELDLDWSADATLELIVERIWNCLRGSHFDSTNAINLGAGQWYSKKSRTEPQFFPVDLRPLFHRPLNPKNIVSYRRKGRPWKDSARVAVRNSGTEAASQPFVIDDSTSESRLPETDSESTIHFIE